MSQFKHIEHIITPVDLSAEQLCDEQKLEASIVFDTLVDDIFLHHMDEVQIDEDGSAQFSKRIASDDDNSYLHVVVSVQYAYRSIEIIETTETDTVIKAGYHFTTGEHQVRRRDEFQLVPVDTESSNFEQNRAELEESEKNFALEAAFGLNDQPVSASEVEILRAFIFSE